MPKRRNRRKGAAHELSKKLRRRFYRVAATATLIYVALSLAAFHLGLYIPHALGIMWAVFLFSYTTFKEAIRWNDAGDEDVYYGEFWATLVLAGAVWMIGWNIARSWIFGLKGIPLPEDYEAAVIETIVLYTLSVISSFLYKYRKLKKLDLRRIKARISRRKQKKVSSRAAEADLEGGPKMEVALTKAPAAEESENKGES